MENLNVTISEKSKTKNLVMSGLLSAMICITTAYIFHIPLGVNNGYVHIGDAFIYLAAVILPTPYAMVCAALGAGLADLVTGSAVWIIPTIIIKPILVLFFTSKKNGIINVHNIISGIIAGIVGTVLYMFASGIMYGFTGAFVLSLVGLFQPIGSFIVFVVVGLALDKLNIKNKL